MKSFSFLGKQLQKIDLVGDQFNLQFNGQKRVKSIMGGGFTLIIFIFCIICSAYFGEDIVKKEKPISRFSKEYNLTKLFIRDIPYALSFIQGTTNILMTDIERYIDIVPRMAGIRYDPETQTSTILIYNLLWERCKPESFGKMKDLFTDPKFTFPLTQTFCIVNNKYIEKDGKVVNDDKIYIFNDYGTIPGWSLVTHIMPCKNNTLTGKVCATQEEIDKWISGMKIGLNMIDHFVDLRSLENPKTPYLFSMLQTVLKGFTKYTFIRLKNTIINTDKNFLFESTDQVDMFYQIDQIKNDISNNEPSLLSFIFNVNQFDDVYNRRYIKIPDILASIGGLIKLLFTVSTIIMTFFSKKEFVMDIGNKVFKIKEFKSVDNLLIDQQKNVFDSKDISNSNFKSGISNLNCSKNNNYLDAKSEDKIVALNMNMKDYMRAVFKCNSKYRLDQYKIMQKIIFKDLEIYNIIRNNLVLNKISQTLFKADKLEEILDPKLDKDMVRSDNDDYVELRKYFNNIKD